MEKHIRVVPARPEDTDIIFAFLSELEETVFDFGLFEKYYLQNIRNENYIYLVALDADDHVNGYLSCHGQVLLHHQGKVFEIQEMFVDKTHRGKGIGRQLIQALTELLRYKDCVSLEVTTKQKRTDAQEFYSGCGFLVTHVKFTMIL
jgi:(aminoalkyl)phosphonate N-acetyltransferase